MQEAIQNKKVTILVPNYRTPEITKICLRLLRKHTDFSLAHVIVVDNNSGDASLEYLRGLKWITLLERKGKPGEAPVMSHARALDLALTLVETPYVISIHTDTFIKRSDWLEPLLKPLEQNPKVAGVGSWKLESKTLFQRLGRRFEQCWKYALSRLTSYLGYRRERYDPNLHYLRSHCAVYRMDVIRRLQTGFADGNVTAGKVMHQKMLAAGYEMVFLESETLGRYLEHLNHATSVLNPELGSQQRSIRRGIKQIRHKILGAGFLDILNRHELDY